MKKMFIHELKVKFSSFCDNLDISSNEHILEQMNKKCSFELKLKFSSFATSSKLVQTNNFSVENVH